MDDLEETRAILRESITASDAHIRRLQELLIKSEERIDKTNAMVCQLASVVSGLKETFEHHIDQAIKSRDHVMNQNTKLLQRLAETDNELKKEREKYEALMKQLLDCMMKGNHPGTSVNIRQ